MNNREKIKKMTLVKVDTARINQVIDIYFHWKTLDAEIRTLSGTRGINFPSEISEIMACYALDLMINKEGSQGDAVDLSNPDDPKIVEIKGSSAKSITAPNSFSPTEFFDELVFVRLDKYNDVLKVYNTKLSADDIKPIKVNKKETVEDQQKQGRRPRFSIQKEIIESLNLTPDVEFNIRRKEIIHLK